MGLKYGGIVTFKGGMNYNLTQVRIYRTVLQHKL